MLAAVRSATAGMPLDDTATAPFARGRCLLSHHGVAVASEPYYDDPGWADVPDHHLVDVADGVVNVTELEA